MLAAFNFIFWAKAGAAPKARTRAAIKINRGILRVIFPFISSSFFSGPASSQAGPFSGLETKTAAASTDVSLASCPMLSPSGKDRSFQSAFKGSFFKKIWQEIPSERFAGLPPLPADLLPRSRHPVST
jgi:hypothetical protein